MEKPANHIKFDFLGKDSIRYENEAEVDGQVWKLVKQFCSKTEKGKGVCPKELALPGSASEAGFGS